MLEQTVDKHLHDNFNPYTKKKFEAIHGYDPYESEIKKLNQAFHHSYNHLIHATHEKLGKDDTPVIIMFGDHVMLLHDGISETVEVIPDLYRRIKSISHVSFGVYVSLAENGYGICKDEVREDLEFKAGLIRKVLSILDEEPIPGNIMETQRKTLENALKVIDDVLASGVVEESRLKAFGEENVPLYLDNAALGAMLELDVLHETVMKWKEQIGPENWKSIYVVICAAHQARYRETSKQYFQRLLHEQDGIGADKEDRVIYAEHIHDVDGALDMLARHLVDQRASVELFNDRTRLQQDLMSDGAAKYLKELLPD
jgi:hypothetical protein